MVTNNDIKKFYHISLFGKDSDHFKAASDRAYRDMCRTINFKGKIDHSTLRDDVTEELRENFIDLCNNQLSQDFYDHWHDEQCKAIMAKFGEITEAFYYGQAQKWVNMLMKY